MSKKHYEAIAKIIKSNLHTEEFVNIHDIRDVRSLQVEGVARGLSDYFETDNPRFDKDRFLKACGVA